MASNREISNWAFNKGINGLCEALGGSFSAGNNSHCNLTCDQFIKGMDAVKTLVGDQSTQGLSNRLSVLEQKTQDKQWQDLWCDPNLKFANQGFIDHNVFPTYDELLQASESQDTSIVMKIVGVDNDGEPTTNAIIGIMKFDLNLIGELTLSGNTYHRAILSCHGYDKGYTYVLSYDDNPDNQASDTYSSAARVGGTSLSKGWKISVES